MTLFYSPSTRGFYDSDIHPAVPDDAVKISRDMHHKLLQAQVEGHVIEPGPGGKPRAIAPAKPTIANLREQKIRAVKAEAARRIEEIAPVWKQMNALRGQTEGALFDRIDAVRDRSNALEGEIRSMNAAELGTLDVTADKYWSDA